MTGDDATPAAPPARLILIAILGAAALLRALYFFEYTDLPFIYGPVADSVIYLRQAAQIRSLTFGTPEQIAFSPLYGYFLALTFAHVSLVIPILLQFALGVATVHVVYRTAQRTAGPGPAAAAAIVLTLYGTLVFFESKILSESLSLFLLSVTLHQFLSPRFAAARPSTAIGAGALLALSILCRASLLFTAPLHVAAALLPFSAEDRPWKPRLRRTLLFTAGFSVVLLANGLWNHHHSGLFVPVIYVADTAAVSTNTRWSGSMTSYTDVTNRFSATTVVDQAAAAIAREKADKKAATLSAPAIRISGWVANLPAKLPGTFSDSEITHQYYYAGERMVILPLKLASLSFLSISLAALLGILFLVFRGQFASLVPLLPIILGTIVTTTLYYPSSRYRLAMIIPFSLLAGMAVVTLFRTRRLRLILPASLLIGAIALKGILFIQVNPALWQISLARSAIEMKDFRSAIRCVNTAEAIVGDQPAVQHDLTRLRNSIADGIRRQQQILQEDAAPP